MAKNKKQKNPFEKLLWEDEKLLWLGKPNTSAEEYINLQPISSNHLAVQKLKFERTIAIILGSLIGFGFVFSFGIPLQIVRWFKSWLPISDNMEIILVLMAYVLVGGLFYFGGRRLTANTIGATWYAVTNKRLCILSRRNGFFTRYCDLHKAVLNDGQFGTIIIWHNKNLDHKQRELLPFVGLNDFDVQEVLRLVNEHYLVKDLPVDDRREKQKA